MSTISPFSLLDSPCDESVVRAKTQLSRAGFRVLQTFDLNTARHTSTDVFCPYHGGNNCDCQLVILLIYGLTDEPVTLILHGHHGQTSFSFQSDANLQLDSMIGELLGKCFHR